MTIKETVEDKKLVWTAFVCSLVFLFIAFKFFVSELPDKNSIVKISGILKDEIKFERRGRGKKSLIIKLKNYPEIDFMIGSVALRQTNSEALILENKVGDSIDLFVDNRDFRRKIVKTEKIPFPENYLHSDKINIVEVRNSKSSYLLLNDYNKVHLKNNYLAIAFFGILAFLMTIFGIKILHAYKHENPIDKF